MVHFIFLIALLFSIPQLNKKREIPFYLMSFLILFIFLSIRYDYGNDYMSYKSIFNGIHHNEEVWGSSDVGFRFINKILPSFETLIAIQSLFYIVTIFELIRNTIGKKYYWLALLLLLLNPYLFLIHLSGIRQTFSICFFVWAVLFKIKEKNILSLFFIFIATLFHSSAIILVPVYFLLSDKKHTKSWIYGSFVSAIVLVFTPVFDLLLDFILEFFPYHYQSVYLQENQGNSLLSVLMSMALFIVILLNYKKLDGKNIVIGKIGIISGIISILTYKVSMLTRILSYFDVFLIVLIPIIVSLQKSKRNKVLIILTFLLVYAFRYYSFFNNPMWIDHYQIYKTLISR